MPFAVAIVGSPPIDDVTFTVSCKGAGKGKRTQPELRLWSAGNVVVSHTHSALGAPQQVHMHTESGWTSRHEIDSVDTVVHTEEPAFGGGSIQRTDFTVNGPPRSWEVSFRVTMY